MYLYIIKAGSHLEPAALYIISFFLLEPVFHVILEKRLMQVEISGEMFLYRYIRPELQKPWGFLHPFGGVLAYLHLQLLVLYENLVFSGESSYLGHYAQRTDQVHHEHSVEHSYEEAESDIFRQPPHSVEDMGMDKEIIHGPKHRPID